MKARALSKRALYAALSFLILVALPSAAQNADGDKTPALNQSETSATGEKPAKKSQGAGESPKTGATAQKPKRGQFATEAEARAHCRGEVVWIDQHNFNHYKGSREWAQKPGAFGCEN